MICFKCDSVKDSAFFVENLSCYHCGEELSIEYNFCDQCGSLWKSCGGNIVEETIMNLGNEGFTDFIASLDEEIAEIFQEKFANPETMMGGTIHKCLNCGNVAFEVERGKFRCPTCEFKWEVIDTDGGE
jgi:hypothetical protein